MNNGVQSIFPYKGGENSTFNPILLSPSDITASNNIIYTTYASKRKRPGIVQAFTNRTPGNNKILGAIDFWRLGTQRIVYYNGKNIIAATNSGVVDIIDGSSPIPIDEAVSFLAFAGLLIIFFYGGQTRPQAWTQSGKVFDLFSDNYFPAFGKIWLNRLWIPDPDVPGRLLASRTGDPTSMTGGDSTSIDLDVNDNDPDGITAIFPPFFGSLYVAKRFSLYKITPVTLSDGTIVFSSYKISETGCISHNAVFTKEQNIIFPSDEGLHNFTSTDKTSEVETDLISYKIRTDWTDQVNFNRAKYMSAVYDKSLNAAFILYPSVGSNYCNSVFGYSFSQSEWFSWDNFNHTSILRYLDSPVKKQRTMVCSSSGDIGYLDLNENLDYGKSYDLFFDSGLISPSMAPHKSYAYAYVTLIFAPQISGSFNFSYQIDGKTVGTISIRMEADLDENLGEDFETGVSYLGSTAAVKVVTVRLKNIGNTYSFSIDHNPADSEDTGFEILGIVMRMEEATTKIGEIAA